MADEELFIGFDHVAYATRDTDATVKVLEQLGFTLRIYKREIQRFNVYITKMISHDKSVAEVVEPITSPSVVSALLKDREATVYHSCFLTNDFNAARKRMKKMGAVTITKPMHIPFPSTTAHETYVTSHMFHSSLGLFEITGPIRETNAN